MIRRLALAAAALGLLGATGALAQDYTLPGTYGETTLNSGFVPDPLEVQVQAGGSINASTAIPGGACGGFIANAPDYKLTYNAGSYPLYIGVVSTGDTTLAVNGPDGQWICDDDSGGDLNPLLTITSPQSGRYDIWIGTYGSTTIQPATLRISELGGGTTPIPPTNNTAGAPDYTLTPTYGSTSLISGFTPDPHSVSLSAGGGYDASQLGSDCRGYVATAPDYSVTYTAGSYPLYISVQSTADTTLVVNGPDGSWHCDDDSGGSLNPLVTFTPATSGRYDIWVGTYSSGGIEPATLNVSELGGNGTTPTGGPTTPNVGLPATYGSIDLQAGFPHQQELQAGGPIDASSLGDDCRGYIAEAPDFSVNFQTLAGLLPLIFDVQSQADTTLVINDPNGNWICNDDGPNGLDPQVRVDGPSAGRYDVWVGTYVSGTNESATLSITSAVPGIPGVPGGK